MGREGRHCSPRLSPVAATAAAPERDGPRASWTLRLYDLDRATAVQIGQPGDAGPLWSPDGTQLLTVRERHGHFTVNLISIDGSAAGPPSGVGDDQFPTDWPASCDCVVEHRVTVSRGFDVFIRSLSGEARQTPLVSSPAADALARVSPDGAWVAYSSNESGRFEVYLQRFPGGGGKIQVSPDGGFEPTWRGDGRELFYLSPANAGTVVMSVAVEPTTPPTLGTPSALFRADMPPLLRPFFSRYDVSRDGERFVIVRWLRDERLAPIEVISGWR